MQKQTYKEIQKWYEVEGNKVIGNLLFKWKNRINNTNDIFFILARALFSNEERSSDLLKNKSMEVLFSRIDSMYEEFIQEAKKEFDERQLKAILLSFNKYIDLEQVGMYSGLHIPEGVRELAYSLLDLKEGDRLLQPYSRSGDVLVDCKIKHPDILAAGIEVRTDEVLISEIKAAIIGENEGNLKVQQGNFLNMDLNTLKYNKVFGMPPMSVNTRFWKESLNNKELTNFYAENNFPGYDDWVNILKVVLDAQFEKAIFIIQSGILFSERAKGIRSYLCEKGYVEGVIELPERLFVGTSITTNLLILSKNNQSIKMVDAGDLFEKDRRLNVLDEAHLEAIIEAHHNDSDLSAAVPFEKIQENDFSLVPRRYTSKELDLDHYVLLGDVGQIKRGHANMKKLNERKSDTDTGMKILTAGDIHDEFTFENLTSLKNIEANEAGYCVENGDIVFARGGGYKSLIIQNLNDFQVMVNGTLYIITCDKEKMNPYYLQLYLMSEHCSKQIESLNGGAVIRFMSIKQLGELKIPKVTKQEEEELASKYKIILNKKEVLRLQKKQLEEETDELLSEVL